MEHLEMFTTKEIAGFLKTSPSFIQRLRRAKKGPPYIQVGRFIRYPKEKFYKWLENEQKKTQDS